MAKSSFTAKRIAFAGVMGALLVVGKFALSFIPNVEVVTTLLVAFSFVFGFDGVIASLIFCTADVILYPPSLDVIVSYYIYWNLLAITVAILKELGVKSFIPYLETSHTIMARMGIKLISTSAIIGSSKNETIMPPINIIGARTPILCILSTI